MANTPRLSIQYPDENQDPFWTTFVSMVESIDSLLYSNMADRNLLLKGGGTLSFNTGTNEITWSADLKLIDYISGLTVTVLASSLTIEDGEAAYIDIPRVLSQSITSALSVSPSVGLGEGKIVLFARSGDKIIFRSGAILSAAQSSSLLTDGPGGDTRVGTQAFAASNSETVTFSQPYADTNYRVTGLTPFFAQAVYAANKTVNGFDILTTDGSNQTGDVEWKVEHE